MADRPIVVAHAGGSAHAPANTLGAYRRAHSTYPGVWMEFDGQFSADGDLVAVHDETLDRTTDWTGFVADRTADELRECNAAAQWPDWGFEPVARVRDILEEGRDAGWSLICEIKNIPGERSFDSTGERYAEALDGLLTRTSFPLDRFVTICFWSPTLDAIRARRSDVAVGFLSVPELPGGRAWLSAAENAKLCREKGYHLAAPRCTTPDLTPELVATIQADGIQVHVWTPNEPDEIAHAVSLGLDGIASDYPDRVFAALDA
jgi:glycerophosphoryl diester phosphodiesterase